MRNGNDFCRVVKGLQSVMGAQAVVLVPGCGVGWRDA
jgi:hypothetical protein